LLQKDIVHLRQTSYRSMSANLEKAKRALEKLNRNDRLNAFKSNVKQKANHNLTEDDMLISDELVSASGQKKRLETITDNTGKNFTLLKSNGGIKELAHFQGNIENFAGMSMIPTGVIGPVRVVGTVADGDFYVPMATSQGSLVATYNRGAKVSRLAGGISSICLTEGIQRCPVFIFHDISEVMSFLLWVLDQQIIFRKLTAEQSRHAEYQQMSTDIEGNSVTLSLEFNTGDAAGHNIITFCADAICKYIIDKSPVKPHTWYIESGLSGEKMATVNSFLGVRGKKVTAEVIIPSKLIQEHLKVSVNQIEDFWKTAMIGTMQSGAVGSQGHFANAIAALFIACGQDAACIPEASVGVGRFEKNSDGDLYASVTLPNLVVGTIGGGTHMPTQRECLEMMDCLGAGKSRKLAEIIAAVVLGGELSISAAKAAGHYAKAHKDLGRKK
jgi:hydroxymethylglutaryl-CoA reductase (NADPH)